MARQKRQKLKARADGRFVCYYKGKAFYGSTSDEALSKREAYKQAVDLHRQDLGAYTVAEYVNKWLPLYKADVSDKTYRDYAKQLEVMVQAIGWMPLDAVRPDHAQEVYTHYLEYSASTIKRARMLYTDVFDSAVDNGYAMSNPFRSKNAKPPKGYKGTHRQITEEERQAIIISEDPFRPALMTMLYAGLRRGEVLALDVDRDVDLDAKTLHVQYAVRFDSNQPILADPKTEAGERVIDIPDILVEELRGHHGLLCTRRKKGHEGELMSESSFKSAWASFKLSVEARWNDCAQKRWYGERREDRGVDLPEWKEFTVRPHDLRHSYATMLRNAGVDLHQTIAYMGHADEKMVLEIYDHLDEERRKKSVDLIRNYLLNGQNNGQSPDGHR